MSRLHICLLGCRGTRPPDVQPGFPGNKRRVAACTTSGAAWRPALDREAAARTGRLRAAPAARRMPGAIDGRLRGSRTAAPPPYCVTALAAFRRAPAARRNTNAQYPPPCRAWTSPRRPVPDRGDGCAPPPSRGRRLRPLPLTQDARHAYRACRAPMRPRQRPVGFARPGRWYRGPPAPPAHSRTSNRALASRSSCRAPFPLPPPSGPRTCRCAQAAGPPGRATCAAAQWGRQT